MHDSFRLALFNWFPPGLTDTRHQKCIIFNPQLCPELWFLVIVKVCPFYSCSHIGFKTNPRKTEGMVLRFWDSSDWFGSLKTNSDPNFSLSYRTPLANNLLAHDSAIQLTGFDLPWRKWSTLNQLRTDQGYCRACHRRWGLTDSELCDLWWGADNNPHRQHMPTD